MTGTIIKVEWGKKDGSVFDKTLEKVKPTNHITKQIKQHIQ